MIRRTLCQLLVLPLLLGANPAPVMSAASSSPSLWTRPLALTQDGSQLWVVNPDSNSVSVLGTTPTLYKIDEIPVGKNPRTLALSVDNSKVYVACQDSNELWILDRQSRQVNRPVRVGFAPYGVVVNPVNNQILVSNQGSDTLSVLDSNGFVLTNIPLKRQPRGMALSPDGQSVYVSHFVSVERHGTVSKVNLQNFSLDSLITLAEDTSPNSDTSGSGVPNGLTAVAVDPSGQHIWVGGQKSNSKRGQYFGTTPPNAANLVRALAMRIDLASDQELISDRIDADQAGKVTAIDFSPDGQYVYFVHQGASRVSVYDVAQAVSFDTSGGAPIPYEDRIDVGDIPQGIVVRSDGQKAYVMNFMSRNVSELDLSDPAHPAVTASVSVTHEALPPMVALGKRHFFDSRAPVQSKFNNMTCASCHLDGGRTDGQVWDLTHIGEGLRNTMDLRGKRGLAQGPLHWTANVDEIQDFENDIVHGFKGTGLAQDGSPPYPFLSPNKNAGRSQDLDALADYVTSLDRVPPSPYRNPDGTLTAAGKRGKDIFFNVSNCASCHSGPNFTDSTLFDDPKKYILHDVGTINPGSGQVLHGPLTGLDTPTLNGIWDTEPYLHDGATNDLIGTFVFEHGTWPSSPVSMTDLVAYLKQLDGSLYDESIIVNVGSDKTIPLGQPLDLLGTVVIDGASAGAHIKSQWGKVKGPGTVQFSDPGAFVTTAQFSQTGTYELEFYVINHGQKIRDTVLVNVQPGSGLLPDDPPLINAFKPRDGEKGYVACPSKGPYLDVFNQNHQKIGKLHQRAGLIYEWNGKNSKDKFVASGIYYVDCDGKTEKLVVLK